MSEEASVCVETVTLLLLNLSLFPSPLFRSAHSHHTWWLDSRAAGFRLRSSSPPQRFRWNCMLLVPSGEIGNIATRIWAHKMTKIMRQQSRDFLCLLYSPSEKWHSYWEGGVKGVHTNNWWRECCLWLSAYIFLFWQSAYQIICHTDKSHLVYMNT